MIGGGKTVLMKLLTAPIPAACFIPAAQGEGGPAVRPESQGHSLALGTGLLPVSCAQRADSFEKTTFQ